MNFYIVIIIAAVLFILLLTVCGTVMFAKTALSRFSNRTEKEKIKSVWTEDEEKFEDILFNPKYLQYKDIISESRKKIKSSPLTDHTVDSYDGLKLSAKFLEAENMKGIVLLMHGYRSNPLHDFALQTCFLKELGLGCFMPYQRAHGDSEGKHIYYGVRERYDVKSWCDYIEKIFPGMPILLYGMSMGASAVMMASDLGLCENVKGIIADCGFTTPEAIFKTVMKTSYGMSPFPFYYTTSLYAKLFLGFSFKGASAPKSLSENRLPILIIHGENDSFVPISMSEENYEAAAKCDAVFLRVKNADHCMSFYTDGERCKEEIDKLIDKCIK